MKRKRGLRAWCGLGLAVAAVAGGAVAAKRYAEQNMLATMLGSGVRAESMQWHWRQAAGCAEQVEIPLANSKDANEQTLQLYAPKLWFVYDQAALLRKRFILPRVVIEDAVISTSTDRLMSGEMVDIEFGADVQLDDLVELPSDSASSDVQSHDAQLVSELSDARSAGQKSLLYPMKNSGLPMPWLDQLQSTCESVLSDKSIQGRQVSIDTDMLSERIQDYLGDRRSQAQRLVSEARDMQQQLVNMDNVLRQPQLNEVARRLEQIKDQLVKLKKDIQSSGKLLDEQQSRVLASLLTEKKQLLQSAEEYQAPQGNAMASVVLAELVKDRLAQPARAVILLADLMRKPLDAGSTERGKPMRYLDQPDFAARSAKISGKLDIDGNKRPFQAEGKFEVSTSANQDNANETIGAASTGPASGESLSSGNAQWQMSIEAEPNLWQLSGDCPRVDGPCTITVTESHSNRLSMTCQVDRTEANGSGQLALRSMVGGNYGSAGESGERRLIALASHYKAEALFKTLIAEALVVDDQTPESLEFEVKQLPTMTDCQSSEPAVNWLGSRLQSVATACMADVYREAAKQLEISVTGKLSDQKGMTATLRNDAEQYVNSQQDELRRIQATVHSLMEQQQPNFFARQPGDISR